MKVINHVGQKLRAEASIGDFHGMMGIFLESRNGKKDNPDARNPDYNEALIVILQRLVELGYNHLDMWVASSRMRDAELESCKIVQDGKDTYHLKPPFDFDEIRRDIGSKQARIKHDSDSKGGNPTKRIFIRVKEQENFYQLLISGNTNNIPIDDSEINNHEDIDLSEDRRKSIILSIKARRGQSLFRQKLIEAYTGRCAITGCSVKEVLEAAHILPYKGEHTNILSNGILLRADIHTLFDLGLINIDEKLTVIVSRNLFDSEYWQYNNSKLKITLSFSVSQDCFLFKQNLKTRLSLFSEQ